MPKDIRTKLIDALSARIGFGGLMEQAERNNTRFLVSRRGKPTVVVLSVEDYLRNIVRQPRLLTEIQMGAKKAGIDKMTDEDIQAEIDVYRASNK